jgi:hypothetical protein
MTPGKRLVIPLMESRAELEGTALMAKELTQNLSRALRGGFSSSSLPHRPLRDVRLIDHFCALVDGLSGGAILLGSNASGTAQNWCSPRPIESARTNVKWILNLAQAARGLSRRTHPPRKQARPFDHVLSWLGRAADEPRGYGRRSHTKEQSRARRTDGGSARRSGDASSLQRTPNGAVAVRCAIVNCRSTARMNITRELSPSTVTRGHASTL